jgi:hypothetical protein
MFTYIAPNNINNAAIQSLEGITVEMITTTKIILTGIMQTPTVLLIIRSIQSVLVTTEDFAYYTFL